MTDWLVLAGCFVIAFTAWLLDDKVRGAAADARLEAFLAEDRDGAVVGPDDVERLGPLALGSLNGQEHWGPRMGAVARLVAAGRLHRMPRAEPGQGRWVSRDAPPSDADEFERELWDAARPLHVRKPAFSPAGARASTCGTCGRRTPWHLLDAAEARLLDEGFTRPRFEFVPGLPLLWGRWSAIAAAATVPAVTVLLLDQAWVRAGPAFVIGAMALRKVFPDGPAMPRQLPVVTGKGETVLRMARERCAELDPATRPATEPYDPGQVRMAVALFGFAVLDRVDARIKGDWAVRRSSPGAPGSDRPGRSRQAQS
ncbi:hypothetical protein ACRAWF_10220 [Streptomyces sp. L7]